jgi:hypothetical protein
VHARGEHREGGRNEAGAASRHHAAAVLHLVGLWLGWLGAEQEAPVCLSAGAALVPLRLAESRSAVSRGAAAQRHGSCGGSRGGDAFLAAEAGALALG